MIDRHTSLSKNLVRFCGYLRSHDFDAGPQIQNDLFTSVSLSGIVENPRLFYSCLRSVICKSPRETRLFDKIYHAYWQELGMALDSKVKEQSHDRTTPTMEDLKMRPPSFQSVKNWLFSGQTDDEVDIAAYSPLSSFVTQDLANFSPVELREVIQIVNLMAKALRKRKSLRFSRSTMQKGQVDIRRSIRDNLLRYDDLLNLKFRKLKSRDINLVLLADASKSMQLQSRLLIQFMYAIRKVFKRQHVFAFSTDLIPLNVGLPEEPLHAFIGKLSEAGATWSSGTRIGFSLNRFFQNYGHRSLSGKTIVIIASDGWDTGDPDLLKSSLRQISRRSMSTVWLNPLAKSANWQPETMGMKMAIPFIDLLIPGHNLEALRDLVLHLDRRI